MSIQKEPFGNQTWLENPGCSMSFAVRSNWPNLDGKWWADSIQIMSVSLPAWLTLYIYKYYYCYYCYYYYEFIIIALLLLLIYYYYILLLLLLLLLL